MNIDQSTMQRRLAALAQRIGQSLVERRTTGYQLTAYGKSALPYAHAIAQRVPAFENFLQSSARELKGVLKLTCPEPIVRSWRMLTTRQLRRTPRVAAFSAFVASEAQAMRKILTG